VLQKLFFETHLVTLPQLSRSHRACCYKVCREK